MEDKEVFDRISSDPDKGQWGPLTNALWDFWKNYSNMREAKTIGADQYFHCMANCQARLRHFAKNNLAITIGYKGKKGVWHYEILISCYV